MATRARRSRSIAAGQSTVLASGDPFHYGVGDSYCAERVPRTRRFACRSPPPSAWRRRGSAGRCRTCALVSLHGRALEGIVRYLQPGARILALSWDGETPAKLAKLLAARGLRRFVDHRAWRQWAARRERVRHAIAADFDLGDITPLNTIALEVVAARGRPRPQLCRRASTTACSNIDGQLTKRDVRAVTLSALAPRQGELLWDVGLGAGSIAIEWLLRHPSLKAIGIEEREDRAARAARNAAALGTPDLRIVHGKRRRKRWRACRAPDAVFIGGGLGDDGCVRGGMAGTEAGRPAGRQRGVARLRGAADRACSSAMAASWFASRSRKRGKAGTGRCSSGGRPRRSSSGG